jgi:hypothetical protein
MDYDPFKIAADRAKAAFTEERWNTLGICEQSEAIYRELRLIDAEIVIGRAEAVPIYGPVSQCQTAGQSRAAIKRVRALPERARERMSDGRNKRRGP